jgi:hypothetical protein
LVLAYGASSFLLAAKTNNVMTVRLHGVSASSASLWPPLLQRLLLPNTFDAIGIRILD